MINKMIKYSKNYILPQVLYFMVILYTMIYNFFIIKYKTYKYSKNFDLQFEGNYSPCLYQDNEYKYVTKLPKRIYYGKVIVKNGDNNYVFTSKDGNILWDKFFEQFLIVQYYDDLD